MQNIRALRDRAQVFIPFPIWTYAVQIAWFWKSKRPTMLLSNVWELAALGSLVFTGMFKQEVYDRSDMLLHICILFEISCFEKGMRQFVSHNGWLKSGLPLLHTRFHLCSNNFVNSENWKAKAVHQILMFWYLLYCHRWRLSVWEMKLCLSF